MESKLDLIIEKLNILESKIDNLEAEICSVSKHVPFVDKLAQSGVVSMINSVSRINPLKLLYNNYVSSPMELDFVENIEAKQTVIEN